MIKDRNIADDAMIAGHKVNGAGDAGRNVFYVGTDGTQAYELAAQRLNSTMLCTTLNAAVEKCAASRGDVIIVLPGHVEDLGDTSTSGAIDLDVAGISVIGIGTGTLQPRIDFNHADSDFFIGADNVTVKNLHLSATVTGVKVGISVDAAKVGTIIEDCLFDVETINTDEFLIAIELNTAVNTTIRRCNIDMGLGGAAVGIKLTGANTGCKIQDCEIVGDYSQACIAGITTLSIGVRIERNLLVNGNANALGTVEVIELLTGTLGIIRDNTFFSDVATHLLMAVADTCLFSNNWRSDDSGHASTTALTSASVVASADA